MDLRFKVSSCEFRVDDDMEQTIYFTPLILRLVDRNGSLSICWRSYSIPRLLDMSRRCGYNVVSAAVSSDLSSG